MMPTARLLNDIGVQGMRVIRTTEAPRWEENAANSCLSLEEYYRSMLDFAVEYSRSGMMMEVETWQYIGLLPKQQSYYLKPVKFARGEHRGEEHCCNCTRSMIAVTSDGEIMPCNQMSGYFLKNGISMGNVHQTPLRDLLGGGTLASSPIRSTCTSAMNVRPVTKSSTSAPHWYLLPQHVLIIRVFASSR